MYVFTFLSVLVPFMCILQEFVHYSCISLFFIALLCVLIFLISCDFMLPLTFLGFMTDRRFWIFNQLIKQSKCFIGLGIVIFHRFVDIIEAQLFFFVKIDSFDFFSCCRLGIKFCLMNYAMSLEVEFFAFINQLQLHLFIISSSSLEVNSIQFFPSV